MKVNDSRTTASNESPCTLGEYALLIIKIGLTSFGGGVSGWMMRLVVTERRWMSETEFLSGLALCQVFPGVNVLNLAIWLGYRLHGGAGAVVGALAILVPPGFVLLTLATGFAEISSYPTVRAALTGVAAAAVGITGSMGVRAAQRSVTGVVPAGLLVATFVAIAVLHWPLVPVTAVLAAISVGVALLEA